MRLLLLKQDRLSLLEERLEKIDCDEVAMLSLGNCRADRNEHRRAVLVEIDDALADYGNAGWGTVLLGLVEMTHSVLDAFLERHQRALTFGTAPARSVLNLCNWVDGKGLIARAETTYLEHWEGLRTLAALEDSIIIWLETFSGIYRPLF
ncbi:hypothetical protein ACHAQJ_003367 [Trichoderma viride]